MPLAGEAGARGPIRGQQADQMEDYYVQRRWTQHISGNAWSKIESAERLQASRR